MFFLEQRGGSGEESRSNAEVQMRAKEETSPYFTKMLPRTSRPDERRDVLLECMNSERTNEDKL